MKIWGRLLGASIGSFFGTFGIIFGFLIGYFFDIGLMRSILTPNKIAIINKVFLDTTFLVMGHISKADGVVSTNEIKIATKIMDSLNLNLIQRQQAIKLFNFGKSPDFNLDQTLELFLSTCAFHVTLLNFFMEFQFQVASADGHLDPAKEKILIYIGKKFNFTQRDFNSFYDFGTASNFFRSGNAFYGNFTSGMGGGYAGSHTSYGSGGSRNYGYESGNAYGASGFNSSNVDKLAMAYKTLGVTSAATQKDIKAAYRKLISRHHPDKLAAKGVPPEMMQFAKEKTQEITVAYDVICKARGFN